MTCSEDIPELPSLHTLVHDCAPNESQVREGGVSSKTSLFLAAFIISSVFSYSNWLASHLNREEPWWFKASVLLRTPKTI